MSSRVISLLLWGGLLLTPAFATGTLQPKWRTATEKELSMLIPVRAPVEKEQIETEMRTAAGVTNGKGQFIVGVVIITAGYAADGKYSHFLVTHSPLKIGEMNLSPGEYVFGYRRVDDESVEVRFYEAASGKARGMVNARRSPASGPIRSLLIKPPIGNKGSIQLGRFAFEYTVSIS